MRNKVIKVKKKDCLYFVYLLYNNSRKIDFCIITNFDDIKHILYSDLTPIEKYHKIKLENYCNKIKDACLNCKLLTSKYCPKVLAK